ncbi:MAG: glycoside hydrolase family 32 protein [Haloarculaceae archaeon]
MDESRTRVGVVGTGESTAEETAALNWAERRYRAERVDPESLGSDSRDPAVVWWHCEGRSDRREGALAALESYVRGGGGLLLSLRGMAAVADLGFDPVAPDEVGVAPVAEPTGPLWRSLHADHPAVASFDDLRIRLADRGTAPYARYADVIPAEGEVLAATVTGGREDPEDTSVVAWYPGDGAVLGVGSPLVFDADLGEGYREARDAFTAGAIESLGGGVDGRYARPESGSDFERLRERLRADSHRPRYHVSPPANWLNDPNGLIRHDGRYHVFYQYNPGGPYHDSIHWGHAVSDDLVHWRDEPVALTPSPDGPDRDGCWSGCAVVEDGTPSVVYTGGRGRDQLPCLARATDDALRTWRKHAENPIIPAAPDEPELVSSDHWRAEFRDHAVWREGDTWYHLVGSGVTGVGGTALLYTGEALTDWTYRGPILTGDWEGAGPVWECPELLRFDESDLLHVSNYEDVHYFLGEFDAESFDVDTRGLLDYGEFYAPQSMVDGDRYLTWGWLPEARDFDAQWDAGWSGTLSVPRVLDVADGRLRQRPAPELTALRERRLAERGTLALSGGERRRLDASGRRLELSLTLSIDDADAAVLSVFESLDRTERTDLRYTRDSRLVVDRSAASDDPRASTAPQSMPVPPADDPLELRVYLDGSTVEVFANERHCLTSRVYPTREDSRGLSVASEGGRARVSDLSVWALGEGWPRVDAGGDDPE